MVRQLDLDFLPKLQITDWKLSKDQQKSKENLKRHAITQDHFQKIAMKFGLLEDMKFLIEGGERSGSVCSLGSVRSSSSLQGSGNTHVLTTPAPSPQPAPTPGLNTHGLNAPGLHAQAEGVKVRGFLNVFTYTGFYHISAFKFHRTTSTLFTGNNKTISGS